jgi:Tfp pilus assembly protein PilZ
MKARVILTCRDRKATEAYLERIRKSEVEVDAVSSLSELYHRLQEKGYNGILIDVKTKVRASGAEKELIHGLLETFPVRHLNLDRATGEVSSLSVGRSGGGATLEEFLKQECCSFQPRAVRSSVRRDAHLNVLLSDQTRLSEKSSVQSVTLNISRGGCFIFSTREWDLRQEVSFIVVELPDPSPITGEVRWQIPWGKSQRIPGIGVKFVTIREDQHRYLCDQFYL